MEQPSISQEITTIICVDNKDFSGSLLDVKKKRGRPHKLEGDRRKERLDVRLTKEEKDKIDADAKDAKMSQSDWVRSKLGLT